jgi:hypothetical protein
MNFFFLKDSGLWSGKKMLLPTAVPSVNLPQSATVVVDEGNQNKTKAARDMRSKTRQLFKEQTADHNVSNIKTEEQSTRVDTLSNLDVEQQNMRLAAAETLIFLNRQEPKYKDASVQTIETCKCFEAKDTKECFVQVDTKLSVSVTDVVKTDKQLNSLTGIYSFQLFNAIVKLISMVIDDKRAHRLSVYNRLFLVFMKLKLDMPYVVFAVLFGVSSQTCKNIFFDVVPKLACVLRCTISLPSAEEIKKNMPLCFTDFQKVRIVLDCIELSVQQHKRLCCRIKCYSHYKGTTTLKFMIGVSPAGVIIYVSPLYGGRASDKAIFEKSGILDKLTPYVDEIMVDKGFLIQDLCEGYGIKIVRPPFLKNKKQFSYAEAIINAKIASARVHVERANARIKIFKVLSGKISVEMIPLMNDIFNIVCGIVNLSRPILADNKFMS